MVKKALIHYNRAIRTEAKLRLLTKKNSSVIQFVKSMRIQNFSAIPVLNFGATAAWNFGSIHFFRQILSTKINSRYLFSTTAYLQENEYLLL